LKLPSLSQGFILHPQPTDLLGHALLQGQGTHLTWKYGCTTNYALKTEVKRYNDPVCEW